MPNAPPRHPSHDPTARLPAHGSPTMQHTHPALAAPSGTTKFAALKVLRTPSGCGALALEVPHHLSQRPLRGARRVPLCPWPRKHRCSKQRVFAVVHRSRTGQGCFGIPEQPAFKPAASQVSSKAGGERQLRGTVELTDRRAPPPRTHAPVPLAATHSKNKSDQNTVTKSSPFFY